MINSISINPLSIEEAIIFISILVSLFIILFVESWFQESENKSNKIRKIKQEIRKQILIPRPPDIVLR